MQDSFRVRISRITYKQNGFEVHTFPSHEHPPTSAIAFGFMEQAERMMDAHGADMRGFVIISISPAGASIAFRSSRDYPEFEFITHAKHILDNYERYSTPLESEDEEADDNP